MLTIWKVLISLETLLAIGTRSVHIATERLAGRL